MCAMTMTEKFYSVDEIAELLEVHTNTVYKLIRNGDLPASRVRRQWRIRERDFNVYLEKGKPPKKKGDQEE